MTKQLLLIVVMLYSVMSSLAFSGAGSGTSDAPYLIFNADQLNEIRYDPIACYSLEADIDLSSWIADNNPTQGWNPIPSFSGVLRGNNHSISNLYINRKNTDNVGLFGSLGYGTISNLHIVNAEIYGNNFVGCLCGESTGGSYGYNVNLRNISIINCIINANDYVGLLVGTSKRTVVEDCYSYGEVTGNNYIGGIIGSDSTGDYIDIIKKCNANISINGNDFIGGIVGYTSSLVTVNSCHANGKIVGRGYVGGIAIGQYVTCLNCFSSCSLLKATYDYVGGIGMDRSATNGPTVKACFGINSTLESGGPHLYRIGGVEQYISVNNYAWVLTKMICDREELGQPEDSDNNGTSIGLTALKQKSTYEGVGWDFENDWDINESESFPFFKNQTSAPTINTPIRSHQSLVSGTSATDARVEVRVNGTLYQTVADGNNWSVDVGELHSYDKVVVISCKDKLMPSVVVESTVCPPGEGTENDPYKIYETNDLLYCSNSGYFELMNDIDLTDWIDANYKNYGWRSISGRNLNSLNGNGHTITGLWGHSLFGEVGTKAIIKNLNIVVADKGVYGSGIARDNYGTIAQCSVSGGPNNGSSEYNGGIAGTSYGTIENCTSRNDIECPPINYLNANYAAGIAGRNYGVIKYCLATGKISGYDCAGIVGINVTSEAKVQDCVALNSLISGTKSAVRIVAGISEGAPVPLMNNYASQMSKVTLNGLPQNIGEDPVNGKTLTVAESMDKSVYESIGWDFNEVWGIDDGYSFPYLKHNKISATSLSLNVDYWEAKLGETMQIEATFLPNDITNSTLIWSVDDPEIASVDNNGFVKALAVGTTQVHVKTTDGSNLEVSCNITVETNVVLITSLSFDPEEFSGEVDDVFTIKTQILPENATDKTLNWYSSNENIAVVDNNGNVSILEEGECIITAVTIDGSNLSAECKITGNTGIEEIISDTTECIEVYNIQGRLILNDVFMDILTNLPSGIYILKQGRKYKKIRLD